MARKHLCAWRSWVRSLAVFGTASITYERNMRLDDGIWECTLGGCIDRMEGQSSNQASSWASAMATRASQLSFHGFAGACELFTMMMAKSHQEWWW